MLLQDAECKRSASNSRIRLAAVGLRASRLTRFTANGETGNEERETKGVG